MSTPPLASVPPLSVMMPFAVAFTAPTFRHVLVLVSGTILASGRRTVAAALRAVGLGDESRFTTYHRVLNRGIWSALVVSRLLLDLLVRTFLASDAPLELVVDGTLERRRGRRLAWKGRFHDAARSQSGHVVTSDGIHWVCVMLLAPVPWSRRRWALPFLTIPTFTPATSAKLGKRHRTAPERTEGLIRLIRRWQPHRTIEVVGDSGFAALRLAHICGAARVRLISRLVLNAQLYDPPPVRPASTPGVKPKKGARQPKLVDRLDATTVAAGHTAWQRQVVAWYGHQRRLLDVATGTALWHTDGCAPLPIRWVLVRVPGAGSRPTHSSAPIRRSTPSRSSLPTSSGGTSKSPSRKPALTRAWRPSASGPPAPSAAPRRASSASSAWSSSWPTPLIRTTSRRAGLHGTP